MAQKLKPNSLCYQKLILQVLTTTDLTFLLFAVAKSSDRFSITICAMLICDLTKNHNFDVWANENPLDPDLVSESKNVYLGTPKGGPRRSFLTSWIMSLEIQIITVTVILNESCSLTMNLLSNDLNITVNDSWSQNCPCGTIIIRDGWKIQPLPIS